MSSEIFLWVACYAVYCWLQAAFLNGIKIAAGGETEKMPNGKDKDSPMLLYPIAKWLDSHTMEKVYYSGEQFTKLLDSYFRRFGLLFPTDYKRTDGTLQYQSDGSISILVGLMEKIRQEGVFVEAEDRTVRFYKEYKKFRFSKYVRMPTLGCIRCMPSYWSLVTFWPTMLLVFGYQDWQWLLWLSNIPIVSFIGTYLATKYK